MQKKEFLVPPRRVALFVTCMVDMLYPEVGMATVELLERQGIEVMFPSEQTCCGQPAFNAGYRDESRALAERFVDIFEPLVRSGQVDALVAPSGSCVAMTTHFYDVLFERDPAYRSRAAILASVTFELTEFLVDVLGVTDVGAYFPHRVTYHPTCHSLRMLRVGERPLQLLRAVRGLELIELPAADQCCGFGGTFAMKNADTSVAMGADKARHVRDTAAEVLVAGDNSCLAHIGGMLSRQRSGMRVLHLAEVLASTEQDPA